MRRSQQRQWGLGLVSVAILTLGCGVWLKTHLQGLPLPITEEDASMLPAHAMISYESIDHPRSSIHVVRIPLNQGEKIIPIIADTDLKPLDRLVQERPSGTDPTHKVVAAINAGFFDPNNAATTSFVVHEGRTVLDPRKNERLVGNPSLSVYLPKIFNRSEFRRYQCDSKARVSDEYAIAFHQDPVPDHCQIVDSIGAGPRLLPQYTGEQEAFLDPEVGRDAIGSQSPNARSAVGITSDGSVLFVMAAQRVDMSGPSGLTLKELADVMLRLDVQHGLNLDGGSSSSLVFQDRTYFGKLDAQNQPVKRPIKSALAVVVPQ